MPALAETTLDGHTLTDVEQRLLMVVWQANAVGIGPDFENPKFAEYREPARRLAAKGELLYWAGDPTGEMGDGYCLTPQGDWIAELLFDSGGHEFGDFLPA